MASVRRRLVSELGSVFSISCSNGPVMPAPTGRSCDPNRPWGHNPELRCCTEGPEGLQDQIVNHTETGVHHKTNTPWHTFTQTHAVTRMECVCVCVREMKTETGKKRKSERDLSFPRLPDKKSIQTSRSHYSRSIRILTKCLIVPELSVLSITLLHTRAYYFTSVNTCMNMG